MLFAVLGSYGRSNIGDEAIADGIAKMLHAVDPSCELVLFTHDTQAVAAQHPSYQIHQPMIASGLRSFWQQWRSGTWSKSIEILKSADWVIIGGGGIFHDHEVGQKGLNPLFIWWLRTLLLQFFKKPILIWSVGVGPIQNQSSSFWLKGILKRAHTITVRDQASTDLAKQYTNKEISIVPDPV
ncbi:polysaccharide pyruvyl transferase family protein, partial [Candidatus Gracilibacteria bacterium]|nr:polysaccharide pyruvyl transferase family protein [Candidatus Gracilibacteria bacterium]